MLNWIKGNKKGIIRSMFLVPIILVMIISIAHVISWYDLSNPMSWAIYLSIAIEIAAMSSIAAASVRVKGGVWFVFVIVTLIQFIGNIFFCYKDTDITSQNFKDWIELTQPVFDALGSDTKDLIGQRRWLAVLEGGLLPLISLASLNFFIKYGGVDDEKKEITPEPQKPEGTPLSELPVPPIEDAVTIDQVVNNMTPREMEDTERLLDLQASITEIETVPTQESPTHHEEVMKALAANQKKRSEGTDKWA
jgi:hypothetical protein